MGIKDTIKAFTRCPKCGGELELIGTNDRTYRYQCKKCYKSIINDEVREVLDKPD